MARTVSDLRRAVRAGRSSCPISAGELRRAVRQADVLGLCVEGDVSPDRTRSELERLFLELCRAHRLPPPEVNVRVGPFLVDFLWRGSRLVVETDGYRYHRGRTAFEADRIRDLRLHALGYDVHRLSHRQLAREPRAVAAVLSSRLKRGGGKRHGAP